MFIIKKDWKETSISLENLEKHMRANFPSYVGNQAHSCLELYFSEELSAEDIALVDAHWDSLDGSDYKSAEQKAIEAKQLEDAILNAKKALVSKTWAQMSEVERKLVLGLEVTRTDMGL